MSANDRHPANAKAPRGGTPRHGALTHAPRVYSWDTYEPVMGETDEAPVRFGASGAATDGRRAVTALSRALRNAPVGVSGVIWAVGVDPVGCARYEYGGIVGRARREADSGHIVWSGRTLP